MESGKGLSKDEHIQDVHDEDEETHANNEKL